MIPRNTTPPKTLDQLIYDNAAVGHQLAMERNDMLVPGKVFSFFFFLLLLLLLLLLFPDPRV